MWLYIKSRKTNYPIFFVNESSISMYYSIVELHKEPKMRQYFDQLAQFLIVASRCSKYVYALFSAPQLQP